MKKKTSLTKRLITLVIVLALLAAFGYITYVAVTKTNDDPNHVDPESYRYEGDGKAITMENDALLFEMDPKTTQFTVTDKVSGEVWRSNPADAASDTVAVGDDRKGYLQSTLTVTYSSVGNTNKEWNNYSYSIENQLFDIEQREDGSVAVVYTIKKGGAIKMMPVAISEERWLIYKDKMGSKNYKKVSNAYGKFENAKLDTYDNKDELLSLYPSLAEEGTVLYVLKSDVKDSAKNTAEKCFMEAGYDEAELEIDSANVAGNKATSAEFNVTMVYRLEGSDLIVEVPYDQIRYRSDFPMVYITVLPMMGSVGSNEDGYLLVPEGGGALIHCNNGKTSQNAYVSNLYGWDYGSERVEVVNETRSTFGVFGVLRENSSMMCLMESGTSLASVTADIAMRNNSYNYVNARYAVLHSDKYNVSAKTAQLVYMYEKKIPDVTLRHRYRFLPTGSYVAMAQAYGVYLTDNRNVTTAADLDSTLPVTIELLGAIDKKVVKAGLPIDSVVATTTFNQASGIITELTDAGVTNMNVRYVGWANGGVNQTVLNGVKVEGCLGGEGDLKQLMVTANEKGVTLYLDGLSCFAYDSGLLEGFIAFRDAARFTTREQVKIYPYDIITYQPSDWLDPFYLVKPEFADNGSTNLRSKLISLGAKGIGYRDIGSLLSGDYTPNGPVNRETVMAMNVAQLQASKDTGLKVSVCIGNDYALPYTDLISSMDLDGTAYTILDAQIPFYQIALHGKLNYTGESINLAGNWKQELLLAAEYGAGLNFTFFAEDGKVLQDTTYSGYYGANYTSWSKTLIPTITRYQTEMAGLNTQPIVDHKILQPGVTATVYADGTTVYVNRTAAEVTVDGITIAAIDYHVERKVNAQ